MTNTRRNLLIAVVATLAGGAGFALRQALRSDRDAAVDRSGAAAILNLRLPDPAGNPLAFSQWQGRALLVNFWATWCEPCREEIPALIRLHQKHAWKDLQLVGISIDSADKVIEFSLKYGISYPLVIGGLESIALTRELGNRAGVLPFTVLISPRGKLLASHIGAMNDQTLNSFLQTHVSA